MVVLDDATDAQEHYESARRQPQQQAPVSPAASPLGIDFLATGARAALPGKGPPTRAPAPATPRTPPREEGAPPPVAPPAPQARRNYAAAAAAAPAPRTAERARSSDKMDKEKLLFRLFALKKKGIEPSQRYTMNSNIEDMREEYRILKHHIDMKASRAFSAKMLVMIVTALEFMNERFDPFDLVLDGWSEHVHENVSDYDEVFDQLYEKYRDKVAVAPEVKLMLMLGGSAFMFHMTNSMFRTTSSVPGANSMPPAVIQQMMKSAQSEVAPSVPVTPGNTIRFAEATASGDGGAYSPRAEAIERAAAAIGGGPSSSPLSRPPSPQNDTVDDILQYITNEPKARSSREIDDSMSVSTASVVTTGGTRRKRRRKKSNKRSIALSL